jgi:flagellar motor switch protein FliM
VTEISASTLFDSYEAPFIVHCMQFGDDPAWLIWSDEAATAAVDQIVTGEILEEAVPARRLSRSECRVIEEVLDRVVSSVSGSLGLSSGVGTCAQDLDELKTLRDAGPDADARRLLLQFSFDGPGGSSDLRLLIPGVGEDALDVNLEEESLPNHLNMVDVEISACLGTVDVPLSQLLEIEVGDVIPLSVEVGTPLNLFVEERHCATATFGQLAGRMAVNLDRIDIPLQDLHPPTV